MRISDWSSDVCSSDLLARVLQALLLTCERSFSLVNLALLVSQFLCLRTLFDLGGDARDRKSVVSGKRVSVRVDLGGRRILKKNLKHEFSEMRHIVSTYIQRQP